MDRRQIGMTLTMQVFDLQTQVATFQQRLILQKAIYLAQAKGVNWGYHFSWYLYGPYCRALTDDGFAAQGEGDEGAEGWELDEATRSTLVEVKRLIGATEDHSQLARRLELLASVHFLIKTQQGQRDDPEGLEDTLREYDKIFNTDEIRAAVGDLCSNGLLQ